MTTQSPLLPLHEPRRSSEAKRAPTTLLVILLCMTVVNFVNFANPGFTSSCLHAVHDRLAKWPSYSTLATQYLQNDGWSAQRILKPGSGMERRIDAPETFDPSVYLSHTADSPSRRMTAEPGIDFWEQSDVDEDLEMIFSSKEFVAPESVRSPRRHSGAGLPRFRADQSVEDDEQSDWHDIAEVLEFYTTVQDDTTELTGEAQAIWQFLLTRSSEMSDDEDET